MRELASGYSVCFGDVGKEAWHNLLARFRDANFYQTRSYDEFRAGSIRVCPMVLRKNDAVVGAAQARILTVPGTRTGVAYVRWGPLWRPVGQWDEPEHFRQAVRALKNEFSHRRKLLLRLYPYAFIGDHDDLSRILHDEGYRRQSSDTERTLILDLTPSLEELRRMLDQKWRNCLNRAEKNGLEIVLGEDENLFGEFRLLYRQMVRRKALSDVQDLRRLEKVHRDLPAEFKLRVVICRLAGAPCAGGIFSSIGDTGLYLCGATGDNGLQTKGAYLVQWTLVNWLKEQGVSRYDLNGVNRQTNPGTFRFKAGLAGKSGNEVEFLGRFQTVESVLSSLTVTTAEAARSTVRRLVSTARRLSARLTDRRTES